ncbi:TPM domain-containing protein [Gordonia humi]|uniref:TPM domain-containing protein n=1 Tax=Gordonia humi TaxID=686429 RepID=UPI00361C6F66
MVDPAGALSGAQLADVQRAVDGVESAHDIAYWVVFVNDFGGLSPRDWTDQTVAKSDFGAHDVILAIATDQRKFDLQAPLEVEGLTGGEIQKIIDDDLAPAVRDGRFADAAVTVGDDLEDVGGEETSHTGTIVTVVIVAVILIAGFGLLLYARSRSTRNQPDASFTADQLAGRPLHELEPWSREVLTTVDRAVRTSADEVAAAVGEFGAGAVAPYAESVAAARAALAASFALRQRIDDGLATDADEHRRLLVEIITTCSDADAMLDRQVPTFDAVRDLANDATSRLDALAERSSAVAARVPDVETGLGELSAVPVTVADNIVLARDHVGFADDCIAQGRDAAAADQHGSVIGAIRSAEGALDQASRLLDAADDADVLTESTELSDVVARVRAASAYIATRRGVIGSIALTRLSEARRLADEAADLAESDEDASHGTAARSSDLAAQAVDAARVDVAEWLMTQGMSSGEYGDLAPVLSGVLVDTVLNGAMHNGGYSHGGRSPASFGGSSSSGRIGVGDRR